MPRSSGYSGCKSLHRKCLPFVSRNVTIFLLFRPGSEKPSAMLLSPWRRSQVVRQRSAKPPSRVRISAAPLTERTRIEPTGSDITPSLTGSNPSLPKVHPNTLSRPNPAVPDPSRSLRATRGATCVWIVAPAPEDNPDLAAVVEAWPHLPEGLKAGIGAMSEPHRGGVMADYETA